MRIVHISDTHLGFQAYRALDGKLAINQREADLSRAFAEAIDRIIDLAPDAVVHTGDLFDSVRPSNRVLHTAMREILRLKEAGLPLVAITGNHELPRLRDTGSIFELFTLRAFAGIHPVFKNRYETVRLDGLTVHAVPQCLTKDDFEKQLERVKLDGKAKYNVLLLHAALAGHPELSMGDFNEQAVPRSYLDAGFDYVALGHFHKYRQVAERACYAGSTERLSFGEVGQDKGFVEVNLKTGRNTFHALKVRPMIDLQPIEADGRDADWVMGQIEQQLAGSEIKDAVVRLTIDGLESGTQRALDYPRLRELTGPALHFEPDFRRKEKPQAAPVPTRSFGHLEKEWQEFVGGFPLEKGKDEITRLGLTYLKRAGEET